ncbi:hypothetical protein T05_13960 [Trichinella murrelli]|uniref:Uncharacterized protein n=1 Tax=Trichinella murrelli TaxID=144512 RepID=A0A0V0SRB3_9BILA|nr:hypothetical protein T05_13960 [Trichinella murrelli]
MNLLFRRGGVSQSISSNICPSTLFAHAKCDW